MRSIGGALAVAVGVVGLGLFLVLGARGIGSDAPYAGVGPREFPILVGGALVLAGSALLIRVFRGRAFPEPPRADYGVLVWILSGLILAVLLFQPLGFAPSAAIAFALTARGFGARQWGRSLVLGLALGFAVYLVFSRALGVSLPGGPLDWR